ncbi:MAG: hypothetical protein ACHQ2Z_15770 [Elusimicrobiota bacterium]
MSAMKMLLAAALVSAPSLALSAPSTSVEKSSGTASPSGSSHGSGLGTSIHPTAIRAGHFSRGLLSAPIVRRDPIGAPVRPVDPISPIACPMYECAMPREGCTYAPAPKDVNGCSTGCGVLQCEPVHQPIHACPMYECAAPMNGCTYAPAPKDLNGCSTGCGTLKCAQRGNLGD